MKKTAYLIFMLAAIAIMSTAPAAAQNGLGIGQSSTGGDIMNPLPGEQIIDQQPMIGVKLPDALADMGTATSTPKTYLFIDGSDVSSEAQLSVDYIFYVPPFHLKLGTHTVMVTYKMIDITTGTETDIPGLVPMSWSFSVVLKVQQQAVSAYAKGEKPSTTGRLYLNFADVNRFLDWNARGSTDDTDVKYHEAPALTGKYNFTRKFYGKTLTGEYERYYEELTGRPNDYFKFVYYAPDEEVSLGDFSVLARDFSEFTINGVRMRGVMAVRQLNPKYKTTGIAGRTQEPQNGAYSRRTTGIKIDTSLSKNDKVRLTFMDSKERGKITSTSVAPKHDSLISLGNAFTYNKNWTTDSQAVFDNHSERGATAKTVLSRDFAYRNSIKYKSKRVETEGGRRTIGPSFTPVTVGSFTEQDREGTYGKFKYSSSPRFSAETFYDAYHDNVRHTVTYDYTNKTTNSISSLMFNYPHLPRISLRYNKQYAKTDVENARQKPGTADSESTITSLLMTKGFNNFLIFYNPSITVNYLRSDKDSASYPAGGALTLSMTRQDSRSYAFSSAYKGFAQFNYYTQKSNTISITDDSKSNTDQYGLQLNIVPFKFITNLIYKRQSTRNISIANNFALTAAPQEKQHILSFIYYLTNKEKLNLDVENYNKQYRATTSTNSAKSYREKVLRLGYTLDF